MRPALRLALDSPRSESYLRQIVFITDGSVGYEDELYDMIESRLGNARLFTVGIGSAPNSWFMHKAAELGRGAFVVISALHEVGEKMDHLFDKLGHPVIRWDSIPPVRADKEKPHQLLVVLVEYADRRFERFAGDKKQGEKLAAFLEAPLPNDLSETFRDNSDALRSLAEGQARLAKKMERSDRSEAVIRSTSTIRALIARAIVEGGVDEGGVTVAAGGVDAHTAFLAFVGCHWFSLLMLVNGVLPLA